MLIGAFLQGPENGHQFVSQSSHGSFSEHPVLREEARHQVATEHWNPGAGQGPVLLWYWGTARQWNLVIRSNFILNVVNNAASIHWTDSFVFFDADKIPDYLTKVATLLFTCISFDLDAKFIFERQ